MPSCTRLRNALSTTNTGRTSYSISFGSKPSTVSEPLLLNVRRKYPSPGMVTVWPCSNCSGMKSASRSSAASSSMGAIVVFLVAARVMAFPVSGVALAGVPYQSLPSSWRPGLTNFSTSLYLYVIISSFLLLKLNNRVIYGAGTGPVRGFIESALSSPSRVRSQPCRECALNAAESALSVWGSLRCRLRLDNEGAGGCVTACVFYP